jgi:hypothetical protein
MELPRILFPSNPLQPRKADFDFEQQQRAALDAGFETGIVDTDRCELARGASQGPALYRGWMVSADRYRDLFDALGAHGVRLLTDPHAYRFCHHLPGWYAKLEGHTPRTAWFPDGRDWTPELVTEQLGDGPLIVKDYVKSAKHYWHEACFIPNPESLEGVARKFLELRGEDLEGGLVFRHYLPFASIGQHPKSGMPLTLEYRGFFWNGRLLYADRYWEVGDYPEDEPPWGHFETLLQSIPSPFFTADLARGEDGRWWIVELGDGQVSGLPPDTDPLKFYAALAAAILA